MNSAMMPVDEARRLCFRLRLGEGSAILYCKVARGMASIWRRTSCRLWETMVWRMSVVCMMFSR